jgi:hypothetical protein
MGIMTEDERFEQFLREHAADYQAPAADVPREAMWEAIRARRAATAEGGRDASRFALLRRRPAALAVAGMAAMLLIGVAIGRFATPVGRTPAIAAAPEAALPDDSASLERLPSDPSTGGVSAPGNGVRALDDATNTAYRVAAGRHLASVEALLTSYQASAAAARGDTLLGAWAKSLLSDTRLLLDSPVAHDPARARLLSDLELILVQLVQRAPGGDAESRAAVDRTLQKTQIIPRLRSAVPAGLLSGT